MNYDLILKHFLNSNFEVEPSQYLDQDTITVTIEINGNFLHLVHFCVDELRQLPLFFLSNPFKLGVLAHIQIDPKYKDLGFICVNHLESVSVNFERPELAFEESIDRHIKLLDSLVTDPEFNHSELLREFSTNWYRNTQSLIGKSPKKLFCTLDTQDFTQLNLYKPVINDEVMSISASFAAAPKEKGDPYVEQFLNIKSRQLHKDAVCFFMSFNNINPIIPTTSDELKDWLLEAINKLPSQTRAIIESKFFSYKAKEFWLIINTDTPSGKSWVGLRLSIDKKKTFPVNKEKFLKWKIEPIYVEAFNKELMLPRSGAIPSLDKKSVLLIGCGSVGSEIADKLGASGIGNIDITDPDSFSTSNMYRHTMSGYMINWSKSKSVANQLLGKYPWVKSEGFSHELLNLRDPNILTRFDLIIIAIGSPTHERLFHDYIIKSKLKVPIINCWLEGYGIGGHAVLDIPNSKGCLRCAYVEPNTGIRGLSSNLNFLKPDQDIVKNYAGCGEMFIPYGASNSAQTALIATNLAIEYLRDNIKESTKVSWKGDSKDAENEGIIVTDRYNKFTQSLKKLTLRHLLCDICNPSNSIIFESKCGKRLELPIDIYEELQNYRQLDSTSLESAGLLIGYYKSRYSVLIDRITKPKETDKRTRTSFKLDAKAHQFEVDEAYAESEQLIGYTGTWHTHPQSKPIPSSPDLSDWRTHERDNPDRALFFIVVGLEKTSVYSINDGAVIELLEANIGE